jgi:hypothetical protein
MIVPMHRNVLLPFPKRSIRMMLWLMLVALLGAAISPIPAQVSRAAEEDIDATSTLYIPTMKNNPACTSARNLEPNFGVQMYGETGSTSKYFPSLKESGANWVRVPVEWWKTEPVNLTPDQYLWAASDLAVRAARALCINVIATHINNPAWAADNPNGVINRATEAEFAEYVANLVERYDGDGYLDAPGSPIVNYWEFYNEPDAAPLPFEGTRWGRNGADYAKWLGIFYTVAKQVNPNAKILLGGIGYDFFEEDGGGFVRSFLEDVLKAGGGNYFDIMNFHAYPAFSYVWTPYGPGLVEKAAHLREVLAKYGLEKPFMVTESGWHSNDDAGQHPSTPEIQARYVVELLVQGMVADLDATIYWTLADPEYIYPYKSGLVTTARRPVAKPAMIAYQNVVRLLGTAKYDRTLPKSERDNSDSMLAYRFVDPVHNRVIYVAWMNPVNTNQTHTLRVPGETATVIDIYGQSTTMHNKDDGNDDEKVRVTVTAQPVFIVVAQ